MAKRFLAVLVVAEHAVEAEVAAEVSRVAEAARHTVANRSAARLLLRIDQVHPLTARRQ